MDRRTSTTQTSSRGDHSTGTGSGAHPPPDPTAQAGPTLKLGGTLYQTVRHFFPQLNDWIDDLDDPRFQEMVVYHKRFLLWWGLALFLFKLGSRRQLDFELGSDGPQVLNNLNRLARTQQKTHPVHNTLNYFLGRIGNAGVAGLRTQMLRRLIRMKALESARLLGRYVVPIDGTGYLHFRQRHCRHCLTRQHGSTTLYLHQALEAKLLGPADLVLSLQTAFIDNRDAIDSGHDPGSEEFKQDCELKALRRLAAAIRKEWPQLRICLSGDSLFGCGEGFAICQEFDMAGVFVFKEGRIPSLWQEFQALLKACPDQKVEVFTPQGVKQTYRWMNDLDYEDSEKRRWRLSAIQCQELSAEGEERRFAWLTQLPVDAHNVVAIATQGGRNRWKIENQGFNTQKNSSLNLEHAYSHGPQWQAYYYLLQMAHMILQLLEKGSLLRELAEELGKASAVQLYGSLKNIARRLLESVRYFRWEEGEEPQEGTGKRQIRLDSS